MFDASIVLRRKVKMKMLNSVCFAYLITIPVIKASKAFGNIINFRKPAGEMKVVY